MSMFDYEEFLKKTNQKKVIIDESEDFYITYGQLFAKAAKTNSERKETLNKLTTNNEKLEKYKNYLYSLTQGVSQWKIEADAKMKLLYQQINEAEKEKDKTVSQHVDMMENLEKMYRVIDADLNPDMLREKIQEMKDKQEDVKTNYSELQITLDKILDKMNEQNMQLPSLKEINEVKEDVLKKTCLDEKKKNLTKTMRFMKDLERKINE